MNRVLFISGAPAISGAEYILADYFRGSVMKKNMAVLCSAIPGLAGLYAGAGVKTMSSVFLNPTGAAGKKGLVNIIRKMINISKASGVIRAAIRETGAGSVAGNNTGDAVYSAAAKAEGRDFTLFVYDILQKGTFLAAALKMSDGNIARYIAASEAVKKSLAGLGIRTDKISVVYNGVTAGYGRPPKKKGQVLTFGYAGSIEARKNPAEFTEFIRSALASGIRARGIMACTFTADAKLYDSITAGIKSLKLPVKVLGPVDRKKMPAFYRSLDYLVVPSLIDPLPTVVMESFACGIPVIGRNAGGLPEMIRYGYNGYLYESRQDFADLFARLKRLTKQAYQRMQENAVKTVKDKFNAAAKMKKINAVLFGQKAEK